MYFYQQRWIRALKSPRAAGSAPKSYLGRLFMLLKAL
jgi:hypothetical protein